MTTEEAVAAERERCLAILDATTHSVHARGAIRDGVSAEHFSKHAPGRGASAPAAATTAKPKPTAPPPAPPAANWDHVVKKFSAPRPAAPLPRIHHRGGGN